MNMEFNSTQPPVKSTDSEANMWGMILHLSMLLSSMLIGVIAPIVIWQMKKDQYPIMDQHGRNAANFLISMFLYSIVCGLLVLVAVGLFLLPVLGIVSIVFPIIAGIKAQNGEVWTYPFMLRIF